MSVVKLPTSLTAIVVEQGIPSGKVKRMSVAYIYMGKLLLAKKQFAGMARDKWAVDNFLKTQGQGWEKCTGYTVWKLLNR
jgi:hypothetical protein